MTMSKARAAREEAQREADRAGATPKLGARLHVVESCADCLHSRTTDACWHHAAPGQSTAREWCYRKGIPLTDNRELTPEIERWPSYAAPPPWCPLPLASPEQALTADVVAVRAEARRRERVLLKHMLRAARADEYELLKGVPMSEEEERNEPPAQTEADERAIDRILRDLEGM